MSALSKLDEFLLNPQVRTCSLAVPRTSRNNNSENRETTGVRSSDDPCPEVRYSSHHFGHLCSPEAEDYPHKVTRGPEEICRYPHMTPGIQKEITYCSPGTSSGKQKKSRSTRTPLRQLKQTRFCWPFNNWRRTVIHPIPTTTSL